MVTTLKYKLAILTSHPIQYQAPLFRKLAAHPQIDLTVYFCSDRGVVETIDPGFGVTFKWDVPLLEGYSFKFLKNYSSNPSTSRVLGLINPGIFKELRNYRYNGLVLHGYNLATSYIAYLAAWATKTPTIFRGETVLRPNRPWPVRLGKWTLLKILFPGMDAFLTIGSRSREFYRYYGVSEERMFFTPYAVDNEFFSERCRAERPRKDLIKQELGIPPDRPVVLFCGKFVPKKRPMDVLDAFQRLARPATLVYVGDGPLRPEVERAAQHLQHIHFMGFQNQSQLPRFYALADVFVLPSSDEEVSPLVVNEAMSCQLPLVISDAVPSAIDFVRHGENGFVYPMGDIAALAGHLDELLADPGRRAAMGQRSLEIISAWNYDTCVEGIVKALEYISAKKGISVQ
jgi:glycosyltransferase involved in cell wall biosynthesis